MKKSKLFISLILVFTLLLNLPLATFANANNNKSTREIVVDGIVYIAEYKNKKYTIQAENSDILLEVNDNGKAKLKGKGVKGLEDTPNDYYDIIIKELNEEQIDITVYHNDQIIEVFDEYADLDQEGYTGQAFVLVPLVGLSVVIQILIDLLMIFVIGGVTYYTLSVIERDIQRDTPYDYFTAQLQYGNIAIAKTAITKSVATERIRQSLGIYTFHQNYAFNAVVAVGRGVSPFEIDQTFKPGYTYYYHYHTADRNGAHAWYGIAYSL